MKRKDFTELKTKSIADLKKMAVEKKLTAVKKKLEISSGKDKNLKSYRNSRLEIARILTLVREKEIIEGLAKLEVKGQK